MKYPQSILGLRVDTAGSPDEPLIIAPRDVDDVARVLAHASGSGLVVDVLGGGTHHGFGRPPAPDLIMSTQNLAEVETWDPDDMTIVVGAGARVESIESMVGRRSQTAVLPERPGESTIGGVLAAGLSSLRRGRLLGTRERVLEVTVVTGDGRVVRAGGRVVKNVTGYDLPRLVVGAFGSLGVITSVCLKLWPVPPSAATLVVDGLPPRDLVSRPLAILETREGVTVYVWGTEAEVDAVSRRLGGVATPGLDWPEDPAGPIEWLLHVPPKMTSEAVSNAPPTWRYLAVHGVGEIRLASDSRHGSRELRDWAESVGGHLIVASAPPGAMPDFDPWGSPPPGLELQRRIITEFDPKRVINPGRLPAGI